MVRVEKVNELKVNTWRIKFIAFDQRCSTFAFGSFFSSNFLSHFISESANLKGLHCGLLLFSLYCVAPFYFALTETKSLLFAKALFLYRGKTAWIGIYIFTQWFCYRNYFLGAQKNFLKWGGYLRIAKRMFFLHFQTRYKGYWTCKKFFPVTEWKKL